MRTMGLSSMGKFADGHPPSIFKLESAGEFAFIRLNMQSYIRVIKCVNTFLLLSKLKSEGR